MQYFSLNIFIFIFICLLDHRQHHVNFQLEIQHHQQLEVMRIIAMAVICHHRQLHATEVAVEVQMHNENRQILAISRQSLVT
jgi:hypothetical protein